MKLTRRQTNRYHKKWSRMDLIGLSIFRLAGIAYDRNKRLSDDVSLPAPRKYNLKIKHRLKTAREHAA